MKWIRARDIDIWSERLNARGELPELVKDLIFASSKSGEIAHIRFPTGDSIDNHGYDGELEINNAISNTWIPNGTSVWEIKTSKDYKKAANADIKKRTKDSLGYDMSETTFVFVSGKEWKKGDKKSWIDKKKKEYPQWKDIQCIDAVQLEDWLKQCHVVEKRYAQNMSILENTKDIYGIDEFWLAFKSKFSIPIPCSATFAGQERQQDAEKLVAELLSGQKIIKELSSDSIDETIAFVVASIRSCTDDKGREHLLNKTMIIKNENHLAYINNRDLSDMILVVPTHIIGGYLRLKENHTLVLVEARKILSKEPLPRPTVTELADSLKTEVSEENDEQELYRAAKESGGSLTILMRRRPSVNLENPIWSVPKHSENIVPALLAGAWNGNKEGDKKILRILSDNQNYPDYIHKLRLTQETVTKSGESDFPIEVVDGIVHKVIAPIDCFSILHWHISEQHYKNLEKAVIEVFQSKDEMLPDEKSEQIFIDTIYHDGPGEYSSWLKDGLMNTLLQIATLSQELVLTPAPDNKSHQEFVNNLVQNLIGIQENGKFKHSIDNSLPYLLNDTTPYLAEAAPDPFLEALEGILKGSNKELKKIFEGQKGVLFQNYKHTHLLWALETIAWDPKYLKRVSKIIVRLAEIAKDAPDIKIVNTPINSLMEIFLAWHPSTNATYKQRLAAISDIIELDDIIGWDLIKNLLPSHHGSSSPTREPIYRESGANKKEILTNGIVWDTWSEIMKLACELASNNPERWSIILLQTNFQELREEPLNYLVKSIEKAVHKMDVSMKTSMWEVLRNTVYEWKSYPDRKPNFKDEHFSELETVMNNIEPEGLLEKSKWLFNENLPALPEPETDFKTRERKINELRKATLKNIHEKYSNDGIAQFIGMIESSYGIHILTYKYAKVINDSKKAKEMIEKYHGKSEKLSYFCSHLSGIFEHEYDSDDWKKVIKDIIDNSKWSDELSAELLLNWQHCKETWNFICSFGTNITKLYWSWQHEIGNLKNLDDAEMAIINLLEYGSPSVATQVIGSCDDHMNISIKLIFESLYKALQEQSNQPRDRAMFGYYIANIFKSLSKREDINKKDVAMMELKYLPILQREDLELSIYEMMRNSSDFYFSIIDALYRKDHETNEEKSLSEEKISLVRNAWQLMTAFRENKSNINILIEEGKLKDWIFSVIKLSKDKDKLRTTQFEIAGLLASAPSDPTDDIWPHREVRNILEYLDSDEITEQMGSAKCNLGGATMRSIDAGGEQERGKAKEWRALLSKVQDWPRTGELFEVIAENYEIAAKFQDKERDIIRMKYQS